jgi:hypothetical protein
LIGFDGFSFHQTFPVGLAPFPEIQKAVIATQLRARPFTPNRLALSTAFSPHPQDRT